MNLASSQNADLDLFSRIVENSGATVVGHQFSDFPRTAVGVEGKVSLMCIETPEYYRARVGKTIEAVRYENRGMKA